MSIEGKHAYRFGYLKSEQWSNVRIEALAREKAACQICGDVSISNDAHHIWYPEDIYQTTEAHLVILCRPCHDFVHAMMPECKTSDEEKGRANWFNFFNAIMTWRRKKLQFFETGVEGDNFSQLRKAYKSLRKRHQRVEDFNAENLTPDEVIAAIKRWAAAYKKISSVDKTTPEA